MVHPLQSPSIPDNRSPRLLAGRQTGDPEEFVHVQDTDNIESPRVVGDLLTEQLDQLRISPLSPSLLATPRQVETRARMLPADNMPAMSPVHARPFGLPAVKELLRFLVSLINVYDPHNTETMRLIALNVLQVVLEDGASLMMEESTLMDLLSSNGCKYLFQVSFIVDLVRISRPYLYIPPFPNCHYK
jgi:hypothetical protein